MKRLIRGCRLIDGSGDAPLERAAVMIEGDRISAVGTQDAFQHPESDVEVWDAAGLTLLPGLIDAHVHILANPDWQARPDRQPLTEELWALRSARFTKQTLDAGFTTVRDMAAPNSTIFALRQAVKEGAVPGPRIIASGNCLTITGGHGTEYGSVMYLEVDSEQEFLNAVRKQWRAGADFIKIIETESTLYPVVPGRVYFSADEMRAGVEEAHGLGLRVAAHANTHPDGLRAAVEVGVDTIEHGYPAPNDLLDQMAARGIILIPTLSVYYQIAAAVQRGDLTLAAPVTARLSRVCEQVTDTARRALERGVTIALGTDAGNPNTWHGDSALELHYLQDAGMTPMQALVAATRTAAEACGWDDRIGTITPGKLADCILVAGDPLASPDVLRDAKNVQLVMQGGAIVVNRGLAPVAEVAH